MVAVEFMVVSWFHASTILRRVLCRVPSFMFEEGQDLFHTMGPFPKTATKPEGEGNHAHPDALMGSNDDAEDDAGHGGKALLCVVQRRVQW